MKTLKLSILTIALMLVAGCEVLDLQPQASLPADQAYTTRSGIRGGLTGAYSALQSGNYYGLRHFVLSDMAADNLNHTGTFPSFLQIKQRNILPNNAEITNYWNTVYNAINRVNTLIAAIPEVVDDAYTTADRNSDLGEARFLRGFHYFNLMLWYGGSPDGFGFDGEGLPLVTTPTRVPADASPVPKSPEDDIWNFIIADLEFAASNINNAGKVPAFASTLAARAMLAKVHLYLRNYQQAIDAINNPTPLITGTGSDLVPNFKDIWEVKNTAEAIFELQFDPVNSNAIAFFYFPTSAGGRNEVSPVSRTAMGFDATDQRGPVTVATSPAGTTRKAFRIATGDDHVVIIRKGEIYLTLAECLARRNDPGDLTAAFNLVNRIRARAGLTPLDVTLETDQVGLINAILTERRKELALEGDRWFDLRRRGVADDLFFPTEPFRALWPIPEREINAHAGVLTQNPGY
jgi:hypothetical protein